VARGELISFLDADDIMLPQCLEKQVAFLEKNNLDMVLADAYAPPPLGAGSVHLSECVFCWFPNQRSRWTGYGLVGCSSDFFSSFTCAPKKTLRVGLAQFFHALSRTVFCKALMVVAVILSMYLVKETKLIQPLSAVSSGSIVYLAALFLVKSSEMCQLLARTPRGKI